MSSQSRLRNDGTKSKRAAPGFESSSVCGLHLNALVEDSSRQRFLQMTVAGTVAGLVTAAGIECVTTRQFLAQTTLNPDAALKELMDGNQRFTVNRLTAHEHHLVISREHTIDKQEPFAAVPTDFFFSLREQTW